MLGPSALQGGSRSSGGGITPPDIHHTVHTLPPILSPVSLFILTHVEDIIDTGNTLCALVALVQGAGAASVRVCALLDKKARRRVPLQAEYTGFECPDEFIVGYGIDYAEKYRNLPYIGAVKDEFIKHS
ncbi:hypothetical protein HYH02_013551 [Chlamydomonas schloesseri]|uniref:Phosphoribosyltransferase domain-containing protein n=1 Tax=Chlamydomonas schloesseri TaxID=2026947 RepID=A0A835VVM3_9CHLO|nr:hypothetical protein HYH02_013551 [Chlamydomonas schloesseri]|eukprot:KAG2431022.1 hypothetical protein HYH02_013551 [Chlamydomonas schloesseri]